MNETEQAVVRWLRAAQPTGKAGIKVRLWFIAAALFSPREIPMVVYGVLADAIERGEHRELVGE